MQARVMPAHIARKDVTLWNLFVRFIVLPPHYTKYSKSVAISKNRQGSCLELSRALGYSPLLKARVKGPFLPENA
jgi:hypothetical protein